MKTKVLKCCVGCSGLKNGSCCCSLPDSCNEYVDVDIDEYGNTHYATTTVDLFNKEMYELQNEQLKQQLAEKEKEIERLTKYASELTVYNPNKKAIEELNAILEKLFIGKCKTYYDVQRDMYVMSDRDRVIVDYINERIKALKGEE